jgi:1-phosphofructokinase family hexose kinase
VIACLSLSASLDVTYVVESLALGEIHRPTETLKLAGGKALNVARAAVALGEDVRAIAVLGGFAGRHVETLLADAALDVRALWSHAETRSCVTIASLDDARLTEIYEQAAPIGPGVHEQIARELDSLPGSFEWLVVSGSIPSDIDLPTLAASLRRCRQRGIGIALDTHGAALARLIDLLQPELVKVNRAEAAELLAAPTSPATELAAGIRHLSGGLVVVTDGANGAVAVGDEGVVVSKPVATVGPYPVGSGDCFLAGFLAATIRDLGLAQSLAVAAACAGANAAVPGAAIFDRAETVAMLAASTAR